MKPTKEIIEKAARRGALLQNVQLIMWEFVKKRESDESVNWIEYAGKIVDVVEGKDTPEGKLISTYKDKLWDKNLELDPDDDTPKETWEERVDNQVARYIRNISVGQYNNNGVNIGFKPSKDVIKDFIRKELAQAKAAGALEVIEKIMPFELVDDCEPDCTPVRHALHEGSWKAHLKLERILDTLREDYKEGRNK